MELTKSLITSRGAPLYQKGSKGAEVRVLQEYLTRAGFSTQGIDGDFGNNTEAAVIGFQQRYNITADGVVYQDTFDALANVVGNYEAAGVQTVPTQTPASGTAAPMVFEPLTITTPLFMPGEMPWTTRLLKSVSMPVLILGSLGSLGVMFWALSKKKAAPRPAMAGLPRRKRRSRR